VFFFYLAVRRVDLSESLRVLGTARLSVLGLAVLVYLSGLPVRALRWGMVLRSQRELSLRELFVPTVVGHMANNVLPARTGELYRAHFLGRRTGTSRSGVVGSIVVERTFDGLMLVGVMLMVLLLFPGKQFLGAATFLTACVFVGLAACILLYGRQADKTHRGIALVLDLLPRALRGMIRTRLDLFLHGIRGFLGTGNLGGMGAYTVLVWTIEAAAIALVVLSFGVVLPPGGYLLVFALTALGTTLPSGPGYIGPYQYAFVLSLGYFAVPRETALAVSIAAHFALLGSAILIGLLLFLFSRQGPVLPGEERETGHPAGARRERVG
jgi:uncharacterized protein (TIRG00374 family)